MTISQCSASVRCCVSPAVVNFVKYVLILIISATASLGATLVVPAGGDLQNAINDAAPGDTIIVQAGATYLGPFVLPNKPGDSYITIQSSRISEITGRVSPSNSGLLARLCTRLAEPVISTAQGAHHFKLVGLEVSTFTSSDFIYDLVRFGADSTQTDLSSVPHDLIVDRVWVHGFERQDVQRGISLNSAYTSIINSYISDIHTIGADTQAICGWNGPGPFTIANNYLEAAGENIMFGGAPTSIQGLIPSNITISQNYFFKPLSWKIGSPSYAGIHWGVKNLLELKNARNVVINGNIFENSWTDGQVGYAILFTVRGEGALNPWNTVQNVTFSNNTIRNSEQGFQLLGLDYLAPSVQGMNLTISNNLLENVANWGFVNGGFNNVTFAHNTHFQGGNVYVLTGNQATGFVSRDNITVYSGFGIKGDGSGEGTLALQTLCPGYVFTHNVVVGAPADLYPPGNFYPANVSNVQFVDHARGDYRLQLTSPYHNAATDGTDIGVDMTALLAAQAGATATASPTPTPSPVPTPVATVQFSSASYSVKEDAGFVNITVTRAGESTVSTWIHYSTSDSSALTRSDYNAVAGTLTFAPGETSKQFAIGIIDDSIVENSETFDVTVNSVSGATLGSPSTTTVTITDNEVTDGSNPIFTTPFFVRQHYLDFLSREPEPGEPWSGVLNGCSDVNNNPACDRLTVSGSFFGSPEFRLKGYFVYRFYKLAFNRLPLYSEIVGDMRAVSSVTPAEVFQLKATLANNFVLRPEFANLYNVQTNTQYVNTLMGRYGLATIKTPDPAAPDGITKVMLSTTDLIDRLNGGTLMRAQVLRAIADSDEVFTMEFNQAFVAMEYYGYLRRAPDTAGYNAWLNFLNANPTDSRTMINGFVNSQEYRQRFAP